MTILHRRWLIAIIIVSVLLRIGASLYLGNTVTDMPGTFDQISYNTLAQRLITGHGFSFGQPWWPATAANAPTAHWSFLYTIYLAAVYKIIGYMPMAARIIQAVFAGILMPLLLFRLGNRVFGPLVGLVAAAISAVYIYFFYYAASLMTETFFILGILWSFDIAITIRYTKSPHVRQWILLGIAMLITTLIRQTYLPIIGLVGLWLWYAAKGKRLNIVKGFSISIVILLLGIAPWTIRNYRVFHQFVLLNTNAGYVLFWANHPVFGTNFTNELPEGVSWGSLIPQELLGMDEASLEKELMRRAIQSIMDDPRRYLLLSLSRIKEQFKFWPTVNSSWISEISRVGSFGLFLPFMCYGTWLVLFRPKRYKLFEDLQEQDRNSKLSAWLKTPIALWLGFFFIYTLMHLISWAAIRYRLATDSIMIIFAAVGIVDLYDRAIVKFDRKAKGLQEKSIIA